MNKSFSFRSKWKLVGFLLFVFFFVTTVSRLFRDRYRSSEEAETISKVEVIETRLREYYVQKRYFPQTLSATSNCCYKILDARYSLSDLLLDGWKSPFVYKARKEGYSLVSAGSDRVNGTKDDILWTWPRSKE